mgnify:FL=1|tara:strand:+ start:1333 stop:2178 length:846 start_codon:yes stop_codon:yes gene_type:complete
MSICIVSPHLDDAVLSCGTLMQRMRSDGIPVVVANVFSKGTNSDNRQAEEHRVLKVIGGQPVFLNELDAPDRDPQFVTPDQIFFGAIDDVPNSFIDHVASRLKDLFEAHDIQTAYFPLGAGNHIDHRIVHAAGRKIKGTDVLFYEDRPYVLWPGILTGRFDTLKLGTDIPRADRGDMIETFGQFAYQNLLPKGAFTDSALEKYISQIDRPETLNGHANIAMSLTATEVEVKVIYEALKEYDSQMPLIFPDFDIFKSNSFAHERFRSGEDIYCERYWKVREF